MIWTAVSFNWSIGHTTYYVFTSSHSQDEAALEFSNKFPGENLLALIAGDHTSKIVTYPLLVPNWKKTTQEENNDCIA